MIDHQALQLALRARLDTLSVVTTGSVSLSVAGGKYKRAAGSFLTDGFKRGMEVTVAGFGTAANNGTSVVEAVTATRLDVTRTLVTEAEGSGRSVAVGKPTGFAVEGIAFQPTQGWPWIEEQFPSGPTRQVTMGQFGWLEWDPIYVLQIHTPWGIGVGASNAYADSVIGLFAPRAEISLGGGGVARVRTTPGPFRSELRQFKAGYGTVSVTVPLRIHTANSI